jgi:hypothetical protein
VSGQLHVAQHCAIEFFFAASPSPDTDPFFKNHHSKMKYMYYRARLEDAADRMQRVVAAVAAERARPPPNTVERAVLGRATPEGAGPAGLPDGVDADGTMSPSLRHALESGQISTRRRGGRDSRPLPFATLEAEEEEDEAGAAGIGSSLG